MKPDSMRRLPRHTEVIVFDYHPGRPGMRRRPERQERMLFIRKQHTLEKE